jgi:hypothetical protein
MTRKKAISWLLAMAVGGLQAYLVLEDHLLVACAIELLFDRLIEHRSFMLNRSTKTRG